jgi:hypothetical protein
VIRLRRVAYLSYLLILIADMAEEHHTTGYEGFVEFMKQFKSDKIINILFSGEKIDGGKLIFNFKSNFV